MLGVGGNIAFHVRTGGAWLLAAIWHAALNALGGQFFFQAAVVVLLADSRRLLPKPGTA